MESIVVPPMMSASRARDAYRSYGAASLFLGGTMSYWGGGGPVSYAALSSEVFSGCTSLKTVVFREGNPIGMFAYWDSGANCFKGCTSLDAVVYEGAQAYWGDPNRSRVNGAFTDVWANAGNLPSSFSLYYAIDYYATSDPDVIATDDSYASGRLARVEYKRGTPVDALSRGDSEALAEWAFADTGAYVQEGFADGEVPDPNEVAKTLNDYDPSATYVWKLTETQSRRAGLSDSCEAYLARLDDISAGRVSADEIAALYKACDRELSEGIGFVEDSPFDPVRFADPNKVYPVEPEKTDSTLYKSDRYDSVSTDSTRFLLGSDVEGDFLGKIEVLAADGTKLGPQDYTVTFKRYNSESSELVATTLDEQAGTSTRALLMTVTPCAESGYSGVLQEWVLVKNRKGTVRELYTDASADTWYAASRRGMTGSGLLVPFTSPYAVGVSTQDASSALVAVGVAGLVGAPISVTDTETSGYGFVIGGDYIGDQIKGEVTAFTADPERFASAAEFAVAAFRAFEAKRLDLRVTSEDYPWGDTAVLVSPASADSVAAAAASYAYAKAAPVFYLDDDGSVCEETLECLSKFDFVAVMGDATLFPESALDELSAVLGPGEGGEIRVFRVSSDAGSSCALSLEVARILMEEGLASPADVSVVVSDDMLDVVGALNCSAHSGGITLAAASSADVKRVSSYLRSCRDDVNNVYLFGRGNASVAGDFDLTTSLRSMWDEQGYVEPKVAAGDTLMLQGALFEVGDGGTLSWLEDVWPHGVIASGVHLYNGVDYVLDDAERPYEAIADIAEALVVLPQDSYTHTGEAFEPEPKVTVGGLALVRGTDYEVSYKENVNVGEAQAIVSGMGSFLGEARAIFTIVDEQQDEPVTEPSADNPSSSFAISWFENPVVWDNPATWVGSSFPSSIGSINPSSSGNLQQQSSSQQPSSQLTLGTVPSSSFGTNASTGSTGTSLSSPSDASGSLELDITDPFEEEAGEGSSSEQIEGVMPVEVWDGTSVDDSSSFDSGDVSNVEDSGVSPGVVGVCVASAVAAVAAAVGFALRRSRGIDPLDLEDR